MRRTALRMVAGAAASIAIAISWTTPAAAHAELVTTLPASGASLEAAPATIELIFSERLSPELTTISAEAGDDPVSVDIDISGRTVVVTPTSSSTPAGAVQRWVVAYRVVSTDGHPISGAVEFAVSGGPSRDATGSDPTDAAASNPTNADSGRPDRTSPREDDSQLVPTLVIGLIMVTGTGAVMYLLSRGRRAAD